MVERLCAALSAAVCSELGEDSNANLSLSYMLIGVVGRTMEDLVSFVSSSLASDFILLRSSSVRPGFNVFCTLGMSVMDCLYSFLSTGFRSGFSTSY